MKVSGSYSLNNYNYYKSSSAERKPYTSADKQSFGFLLSKRQSEILDYFFKTTPQASISIAKKLALALQDKLSAGAKSDEVMYDALALAYGKKASVEPDLYLRTYYSAKQKLMQDLSLLIHEKPSLAK